jgi:flagellar motor protein MotB
LARKKKEDTPAPGSPAWMATFSDLMNLLLCFFVLPMTYYASWWDRLHTVSF